MTIFHKIKQLLITLILVLPAGCSAGGKDEQVTSGSQNLSKSFSWFLSKGLPLIVKDRDYPIRNELQSFNVSLGADIGFGDSPYKVMMYAHSSFMTGSLVCYERTVDSGKIYEYWVEKIGSRRTDVNRTIRYVLTESNSLSSSRQVLNQYPKFVEWFELPSGKKINFPENEKVVGMLMPWIDRELYVDTFMYKYNRKKINGKFRVVAE